jgi:hypothetical protein
MGVRQKAKAAARAASAEAQAHTPVNTSISQAKAEESKTIAMINAEQLDGPEKFIVPELTVKDCLSVIPYVDHLVTRRDAHHRS